MYSLTLIPKPYSLSQAAGGTYDAALETQLCFEVKTFLLAGHETSAAMLTWTLYELICRPDAMARVPPCFLAYSYCLHAIARTCEMIGCAAHMLWHECSVTMCLCLRTRLCMRLYHPALIYGA